MAGRDIQGNERADEGRRDEIIRREFSFVCRKCKKKSLGWSRGGKSGSPPMCLDCLVRDIKTALVLVLIMLAGCKKHHQDEGAYFPQWPPGGCIVEPSTPVVSGID